MDKSDSPLFKYMKDLKKNGVCGTSSNSNTSNGRGRQSENDKNGRKDLRGLGPCATVDGQLMKDKGVIYAPDFIANAGGLIRLAGLYLGLSETEIDQKVDRIEHTTLEVLKETRNYASAYEAAVSYARQRIEAGRSAPASS